MTATRSPSRSWARARSADFTTFSTFGRMLPLTSKSKTISRACSPASKPVVASSCPSSNTRKSSLLRPRTGAPFLSNTSTSTWTSETEVRNVGEGCALIGRQTPKDKAARIEDSGSRSRWLPHFILISPRGGEPKPFPPSGSSCRCYRSDSHANKHISWCADLTIRHPPPPRSIRLIPLTGDPRDYPNRA